MIQCRSGISLSFVLAFALLTAVSANAQTNSPTPAQPDEIDPYMGEPECHIQSLFQNERFPNIVATKAGTLLAAWGSENVRVRRSENGGKTWGPEISIGSGIHGGGTTVDETSGDILVFAEAGHPPSEITMYRSKDDGKTWLSEKPKFKVNSKGHLPSMHMNEHGITLQHGQHKGRLIRPSRYYGETNDRSEWPDHYTNAAFSDDGGKTWQASEPFPENGTGEACIIERNDGTLYYNSRVHWQERPKNTRRRSAISRDGGATWQDWTIVDVLPDGHQHRSYGCMGGLVRLPIATRDILIFSNIDTPNAKRERATVWASFDGGKTWPVKRLVNEGSSAYSALAVGRHGTDGEGFIFLHFESGGGSKVARFNLKWLIDGEKTGDGQIPALQK